MFFLFYLWIPLFYIIILVDKPSSLGQNYSASNGGAAEADNYLRVLIVGDSVNRCMVQDWCSKYSGTLLMDHSTDSTNFSTPYPVSYYFKRFGKRGKSWEIRICESFSRRTILAMVHNKFGVKPCSPWHCPIATMSGIESELIGNSTVDQGRSLTSLFRIGLYPCLPAIAKVIGGQPHGILINSAFWDLSHPDPSKSRLRSPENWLKSWTENVTTFMGIIQDHFRSTKWFGWHTANWFHTVEEGHHWNSKHALRLLDRMNSLSEQVARSRGFDWIPFHQLRPLPLRDMMHPAAEPLVWLADSALSRIANCTALKNRVEAGQGRRGFIESNKENL